MGWMQAHALQYINQIGVGIDAVQAAGDQQTLDHANVLGTDLGPVEQPVTPAYGNDP